jgi:hypothetical protein
MLVIKALINYDKIDEIWIHRLGKADGSNTIYKYRIEKPKGFEKFEIYHIRSDGWVLLTLKALDILERNGYNGREKK